MELIHTVVKVIYELMKEIKNKQTTGKLKKQVDPKWCTNLCLRVTQVLHKSAAKQMNSMTGWLPHVHTFAYAPIQILQCTLETLRPFQTYLLQCVVSGCAVLFKCHVPSLASFFFNELLFDIRLHIWWLCLKVHNNKFLKMHECFFFFWLVFLSQIKIFFSLLFYHLSPRLSFSHRPYLLFSLSQFSRSVKTVQEAQRWLSVLNVLTMIIQKLLLSIWSLPVCLSFFMSKRVGD